MTSKNTSAQLTAIVVVTVLLLSNATAQTNPGNETESKEELVALEPITIVADIDNGYQSNETLAATRLRGKTKDVASAITVITPEMLNDLGVTNFAELADFLPSSANYHINEGDSNGNGPRSGAPFYVRGFRSDSITVNFFSTLTPIDIYNANRVTFSRGPNSILFGIGSPGGSVDNPSNRADIMRNFGNLTFRVDSFESNRVTVDQNLVLVPRKLAVRVDLLDGNNKTNIEPNRNQRDSAFITATYKPTNSTIVTANVEGSRIRQQIPKNYTIFDWYSTWNAAGQPLVAAARGASPNGTERLQSAPLAILIPGLGAMNWASMSYGERPLVLNSRRNDVGFGQYSPTKIIPLDVNAMGDADRVTVDTKMASVFVTQRLAEGLYLELAAQTEHANRMNMEPDGNTYAINVDPNAHLPNGAVNPYAGVPYLEITPSRLYQATDATQFRATLSYEKDLSNIKVFNRGLAKLSFAGLYSNSTSHQFVDQFREINSTPQGVVNPQLNNTAYRIRRPYYLTPLSGQYFRSNLPPINEPGIKTECLVTDTGRNDWNRSKSFVFGSQALLFDELLALTAGVRRDEVEVQGVNYTRSPRAVFEEGAGRPSHGGSKGVPSEGVGRPYLFGAGLHATKNISLFPDRSTNYQGVSPSSRDIYDNYLPNSTGRGFDIGSKFFLMGDRISGSFSYFETEQDHITDGGLAGSKRGWINSILQAIDPSKLTTTTWTDTKNQKTHGIEFQVVGNPTKNLRLMANVSRNVAKITDRGAIIFAYLDKNYPIWLANAAVPVVDPNGNNVGALVNLIKKAPFNNNHHIAIKSTHTYISQTNFIARYHFHKETMLKGFAIGSAARWRSAPVIGFASIAYPSTVYDLNRPFKGNETWNLDSWLEYKRVVSLGGKKIGWNVQGRVQNLLRDREP